MIFFGSLRRPGAGRHVPDRRAAHARERAGLGRVPAGHLEPAVRRHPRASPEAGTAARSASGGWRWRWRSTCSVLAAPLAVRREPARLSGTTQPRHQTTVCSSGVEDAGTDQPQRHGLRLPAAPRTRQHAAADQPDQQGHAGDHAEQLVVAHPGSASPPGRRRGDAATDAGLATGRARLARSAQRRKQ